MHPSHYSSHATSSAKRQYKNLLRAKINYSLVVTSKFNPSKCFDHFRIKRWLSEKHVPPCAPPPQTASDYYIMQYYPQYDQAAAAAAAATTTGGSAVANGSGTYGYTPHATQSNPQQYSYQTMYSIPQQGNGLQQQQPSGGSG